MTDYLSWGRTTRPRQSVLRPSFADELPALLRRAAPPVLAFGNGRSYGDVCLNDGGTLIDMRGLQRLVAFDAESGVLEVEAGVTLASVLALLTRTATRARTWFLPVSPGTKFITVGGAIANDVHGKNHHLAGCFGRHVLSLRLLRSDGETLRCSPQENRDLFAATIGGLGLTGLVLSATIQLKRVASMWLECEDVRVDSLAGFTEWSEASKVWDYTVGWIDCLAGGAHVGRGIFTRARHVERDGPAPTLVARPRLRVPLDAPAAALNGLTVSAFNALYWRRAPRTPGRARIRSYEPVFYPLDALGDWNRIYGRRGFHQYQCVLPGAASAMAPLLEAIRRTRQGSFLAVIKQLGDVASPGLLSFPRAGTTLALDFPHRGASTLALLERLDQLTEQAGGRVYPAKDGRLSARRFQHYFPHWQEFARHVDPLFSSSFWRRVSAA